LCAASASLCASARSLNNPTRHQGTPTTQNPVHRLSLASYTRILIYQLHQSASASVFNCITALYNPECYFNPAGAAGIGCAPEFRKLEPYR